MKTQYEVVDSAFNRANYSDLIGKIFDNPPAYANVRIVKEKMPMKEIFRLQSRFFEEEIADDMIEDFVIKCLREGYEKDEIINGITEFYRQAKEPATNIFNRAVLKMKGVKMAKKKKRKSPQYDKSPTEHGFMDECMEKNKGKVKDEGAYCAAIVDRAKGTTDWREGPRSFNLNNWYKKSQIEKSVQDEFKAPCKKAFAQAVQSMKFLVKWHDKEALFQELRDVVEGRKNIK